MIKEQLQQKVKFAVQRGDFIMAAEALNSLTKLEPYNIRYAEHAADMNKKIGADEQAAAHYANIARNYIEQGKMQEASQAISTYHTLYSNGIMLGRELYHLCRSKKQAVGLCLPFLHHQDRLTFLIHEHPMFCNIDSNSFTTLFTSLQCLNFNDGEIVTHQGDHADNIFIVVKGALQPWVEEDDGKRYGMVLTEAGGVLGESPFLIGTTERTADLIAVGETEIYTLSYQCLQNIADEYTNVKDYLQEFYNSHLAERQLAKTPFFRKLSIAKRRKIAEQMHLIKIEAGATLCTVGEHQALDFYAVVSGWLSVNSLKGKQESLLYTAKAHSVVGELGIIKNIRNVTIRAISEVQLLCWSEKDYRAYYRNHESLRDQLADRLLRLNQIK